MNPAFFKLLNFKINPANAFPAALANTEICQTLRWGHHIYSMVNTISSKIGGLRRLKCVLTANTLTILYSAIVLPHFDYADSVYDSCTELDKTRLQCLQSRAARILTGSNIPTHRPDMFKDLTWISLQHRRDMNKCILMYKCLNNLVPCYLTDMFETNNSIHQYRTHKSNNLSLVFTENK